MFPVNNSIAGSGLATLVLDQDGGSVVRVVYSDESGVGSMQDEPITIVAGLMLNIDSQWNPVLRLIETALADYVREEKSETYEIRAGEIYNWIKKNDENAARFMGELVSIPTLNRVPIFYRAIDRRG